MPSPYMSDAARAAMPQSALQPLPPYLRADFAQSLDRDRPHELIVPVVGGKLRDPVRMNCLQYRYLDTDETVTVPNCWYNQTVEMRLVWWQSSVQHATFRRDEARAELARLSACRSETLLGKPVAALMRELGWQLEERERVLERCTAALHDVETGRRFI